MKVQEVKQDSGMRYAPSGAMVQKRAASSSAEVLHDHRPARVHQAQLQAMVSGSPQVRAATQLQAQATRFAAAQQAPVQRKSNTTGLPDSLKAGIEHLSGIAMDDVKVHRNSTRPAQLQAHAYAQGSNIHIGPGQEQHLPHEAWHVVQQKQGRVRPTLQLKGQVHVNDDSGLEKEADEMGGRALRHPVASAPMPVPAAPASGKRQDTVQRLIIRARDMKEIMMNPLRQSGTILSSANLVKNRPDIQNDHASPNQNEDVGIGQIDDHHRQLTASEQVIVVSHGSEPKPKYGFLGGEITSSFAGKQPADLAAVIQRIAPPGYSGNIYLNGCYTGVRYMNQAGTSYVEKFDAQHVTTGTIKGNVGAASSSNQEELITITPQLLQNMIANNLPIPVTLKFKQGGVENQTTQTPTIIQMLYNSAIADPMRSGVKMVVQEVNGTATCQGGNYVGQAYT